MKAIRGESLFFLQHRHDARFFEVEGSHLHLDLCAGLQLWPQREAGPDQVTEGNLSVFKREVDSSFVAFLGHGGGGYNGLSGHRWVATLEEEERVREVEFSRTNSCLITLAILLRTRIVEDGLF